MMKPRRVVMTFGTNDTGMEVSDFIAHYTALIQAIQQSYPYTDIIVNTVPPVPADHSNYPHMDQAKIDDFNMALLDLCEQLGVRFLNSAEALKGSDGYGIADYYTSGDIHLKSAGLKAVLNYLRTHALQTEDRRPDTNNIPTRTMEYVSNPSSAVAAPSSEAVSSSESQAESASSSESSSSESTSENKKFEAHYRVDKNGGGTLSVGNDTGNSSVTYTVTDPDKSITVTAVPAEGHVFVKWSDGLTSKTRTDTDFKQNLDVTAVFGTASVHITSEGKGVVGSSYTFKAALSGKYAKTENLRWYANGQEVTQAAGKSSITVVVDSSMANASYKIHAVVTYNDCKVSSNTLTITIGSGVTSESGSTSSSSSSHAGSSGEYILFVFLCKFGQLFPQHQQFVVGIVQHVVWQLQGRVGVRKQGRVQGRERSRIQIRKQGRVQGRKQVGSLRQQRSRKQGRMTPAPSSAQPHRLSREEASGCSVKKCKSSACPAQKM